MSEKMIELSAEVLLALLRQSLGGEKAVIPPECDWLRVFELALSHRVETLIINEAFENNPPPDVARLWQERAMMMTLRQMQTTDSLVSVLAAFEEAGLCALVLKGIVLKALYADPDARQMSDADLLIGGANFAAGRELLLSLGFAENKDDTLGDTFVCENEAGLRIELHRRLFEQKKQGFLASLDEEELFGVNLAVRFPAYGGDVWSLPPTQHALFLLLHMAKHMITTGFGLRQTIDFGLFTKAYESEIDWALFREVAERLSLTRFTNSIGLILCDKLGLGVSAVVSENADRNYESLLADILDAGVFGKSTAERERSAAVTLRAFDSETTPVSGFAKLRRAVFIRADELRPPFDYARRKRFLLPIAWLHRLFAYAFSGRASDARGGVRVADERMNLLKSLGMMR